MNKTDAESGQADQGIGASGQGVRPGDQPGQTGRKPPGNGKDTVDSRQADRQGDRVQGRTATEDGKASHPFLADIEPFLFGRPITYVDVGAHVGAVMQEILKSSIIVREAHLIEPNPGTFAALQEAAAGFSGAKFLTCHNTAISAVPGKVTMRDEDSMTHIVTAGERGGADASGRIFEVEAVTLDELARLHGIRHVNLLKVDVEGHELAVFHGAVRLLETQSIDIIYVEAGLDPESNQQTYYRAIEDALNVHGYRLFRIYEQKNEWLDDNPFLRRINLAFMSARFANGNPYKVTQQLFDARRRAGALAAQLKALQEEQSRGAAAAAQRIAALERDKDRSAEEVATLTRLLETTQAEMAALAGRLETEGRELNAALAERDRALAERGRALETAQAEAAALRVRLEARSREIASLIGHAEAESRRHTEALAGRDRALEAAQAEAAALKAELEERRRDLDALARRAEELRHHNDSLLRSTSWRITAPARYVVTLLRGSR